MIDLRARRSAEPAKAEVANLNETPPEGGSTPPGLLAQLKRTLEAARTVAWSHVNLAKAELGAIKDEVVRVAAFVAAAVAMLLFAAMLLPIGLTLFVGEWLFGSMGWGILHGAELSIGLAIALVLAALGISGGTIARRFLLALLLAAALTALVGLQLPNQLWVRIGDDYFGTIDRTWRSLAAALVVGAAVVGVLSALSGLRRGFGGLIGGLVGGAVLGALVGAASNITLPWHVAVATGLALFLGLWPILCLLALRGFDGANVKDRFYPTATIETAQETFAWLKTLPARLRPGAKS